MLNSFAKLDSYRKIVDENSQCSLIVLNFICPKSKSQQQPFLETKPQFFFNFTNETQKTMFPSHQLSPMIL
jgi:hypothetical protein